MKVETTTPGMAVEVTAAEREVRMAIGDSGDAGWRVVSLSVPQAGMILHALGLAMAQIGERERLLAEDNARLVGQLADE